MRAMRPHHGHFCQHPQHPGLRGCNSSRHDKTRHLDTAAAQGTVGVGPGRCQGLGLLPRCSSQQLASCPLAPGAHSRSRCCPGSQAGLEGPAGRWRRPNRRHPLEMGAQKSACPRGMRCSGVKGEREKGAHGTTDHHQSCHASPALVSSPCTCCRHTQGPWAGLSFPFESWRISKGPRAMGP